MCVMHIDSILEKNRSKNEDIANEKYMYFEGRFPIKNYGNAKTCTAY